MSVLKNSYRSFNRQVEMNFKKVKILFLKYYIILLNFFKKLFKKFRPSLSDEEEFWNIIRRIEQDITLDYEKTGVILSLRPKVKRYMRINLGIIGMAFGYADKVNNKFILLQSADTKNKLPWGNIDYKGYTYENKKLSFDEAKIIDQLFLLKRENESLSENPPEFYAYLENNPPYSKYIEEYLTQPYGLRQKGEWFLGSKDKRLLFSDVSEILFFLYTWRWLIRIALLNMDLLENGKEPLIDSEIELKYNEEINMKWYDCKIFNEHSIEDEFCNYLYSLFSGSMRENVEVWNKMVENIDGNIDRTKELQNLGLIGENNVQINHIYAFRSLLNFTNHLGNKILENFTTQKIEDVQNDEFKKNKFFQNNLHRSREILLDAIEIIKQTISQVELICKKNETEYGTDIFLIEKEKFITDFLTKEIINKSSKATITCEKAIRTVALVFLSCAYSEDLSANTFSNLLLKLHQISRFPIIPYYYLTAWDKTPKQQLVFPTWESNEFKVPVNIPNYISSSKKGIINFESKSSAVVCCLITLKPFWQIYYSENKENNDDFYIKSFDYMRKSIFIGRVITFSRWLATPIIDNYYYGGPVQEDAITRGRLTERHSIPAAFSNSIRSLMAFYESYNLFRQKYEVVKNKIVELKDLSVPKFDIPTNLFAAAFESMIICNSVEELKKNAFRLYHEENILRQEGVSKNFISSLADKNESVAQILAYARIRPNKPLSYIFEPVRVVVIGEEYITFEKIKQTNPKLSDLSDWLTVGIFTILLKEAIQHTVEWYDEFESEDFLDQRFVKVEISASKQTITFTNPTINLESSYGDNSNQEKFLELVRSNLPVWQFNKPVVQDNRWKRSIILGSKNE